MNKEFYSIVSPCSDILNRNYINCEDVDDNNYKKKKKINMLFGLFITIFAMYLAYDCNKYESVGMRLLYTIIAGLFSGLYLLYYLVVRVFLGNKCYKKLDKISYSSTSNNSYGLFEKK